MRVSELTQVLDVLIRENGNDTVGRLGAGPRAGTLGLVDDDAVGDGGGDEGSAVRELGHAAVVVHP